MEKIQTKVSSLDLFADKPCNRLTFNGNETHKSCIGGCCSILMMVILTCIVIVLSWPILQKEKR